MSHRHHDAVWDNAPHLPLEDRLFLIGDPNEVRGRRPCSKGASGQTGLGGCGPGPGGGRAVCRQRCSLAALLPGLPDRRCGRWPPTTGRSSAQQGCSRWRTQSC